MLQFARAYPINSAPNKLSWAHYRELLSVNDAVIRNEITEEVEKKGWSQKQLRSEIKKRKFSPGENTLEKLPEVKPGEPGVYRVLIKNEKKYFDLGFFIYHEIIAKDSTKVQAGDVVQGDLKARGSVIIKQKNRGSLSVDRGLLYTYNARVIDVYDGDTFHALIDLGFGNVTEKRVRLLRIDAPEIESSEGEEAKALLEEILSRDGGKILIQSKEMDQHGRPLANVWVNGKSVDQELLDEGLAVRVEE